MVPAPAAGDRTAARGAGPRQEVGDGQSSAAIPVAAVRKLAVGTPTSAGDRLPGTTPYRMAKLTVDKKAAKAELHAPAAQRSCNGCWRCWRRRKGRSTSTWRSSALRQAWNLSRAGDKVRAAVDSAAAACEQRGELRRRGEFLWPAGTANASVRVPDPKDAATFREIDHISDEELQAGLRLLLTQGGGMNADAILSQTARLFGFAKLGDTIKERVQACVAALQQQGACVERGGGDCVAGVESDPRNHTKNTKRQKNTLLPFSCFFV